MKSNSLFTIPVGDLLSSYSGDSKSFSFSGEVPDGFIEDIHFRESLDFQIEIIASDNSVEVIFHNLSTQIEYEGKISKVAIGNFERTFRTQLDPLDPDDVQKIENAMIDLGPVIREELIMATYTV